MAASLKMGAVSSYSANRLCAVGVDVVGPRPNHLHPNNLARSHPQRGPSIAAYDVFAARFVDWTNELFDGVS